MPLTEAEALEGILNVLNGTTAGTPILAIRDHLAAIRAAQESQAVAAPQIKTAIEGVAPTIAGATINQTQARQPLDAQHLIKRDTQSRTSASRTPGIPR